MNIIQRPSPNFVSGRQGQIPDHICLHTTGGTTSSAINTVLNKASEVSYHFIIAKNGDITQHVDIRNWAFSNGTRNDGGNLCNSRSTLAVVRQRRLNANLYTVSISFGDMPNGNPSAEQINSVVWLINHINNEIEKIYGKTHRIPINRDRVIGHGQITPLTRLHCPGLSFPFDEVIRRVNTGSSVPVAPSALPRTPASAPEPTSLTGTKSVGDVVTVRAKAVYGGLTKARGTEIPQKWLAPTRLTINKIQVNNGVAEARLSEIVSWVALDSLDVVGTTAPPVVSTPPAPAIKPASEIADDIWVGRKTNNGQLWGTGAARKANLIKYGGEAFQKEVQTLLDQLDAAARARK